jgi:hypothetical protein
LTKIETPKTTHEAVIDLRALRTERFQNHTHMDVHTDRSARQTSPLIMSIVAHRDSTAKQDSAISFILCG